jgi:hypothetical protein
MQGYASNRQDVSSPRAITCTAATIHRDTMLKLYSSSGELCELTQSVLELETLTTTMDLCTFELIAFDFGHLWQDQALE